MDALILSNIIQFIPYRKRYIVEDALHGYIPIDVKDVLFHVDLEKVDSANMEDAITHCVPGGFMEMHPEADAYKTLIRRKIYVADDAWDGSQHGDECIETMIDHVNASPLEWFIVSPWHQRLWWKVSSNVMKKLLPLSHVPYSSYMYDTCPIDLAFRNFAERFTRREILESYVNARVPINGWIFRMDDEMIPIIIKAVRLRLWKCSLENDDMCKVILASPTEIYNELCFHGGLSPVHSYILAHITMGSIPKDIEEKINIISSAPDELIMRAFHLSVKGLRR
jgi:hypothetical protein